MSDLNIIKRFWIKVEKSDNCWNWKSATKEGGYGVFYLGKRKTILAHRFSYNLLVGKVPTGKQLDHLCRNPKCVNPNHLEVVTGKENVRRGNGIAVRNHAKTHCIHGHEFTRENMYYDKIGGRECRTCRRERRRKQTTTQGKCSL